MPEKLKELLKSLSKKEADDIWEWIDRDPRAIELIVDELAPIALEDS